MFAEGSAFPCIPNQDGISSGSAHRPPYTPSHTQHGGALQCLREGLLFPASWKQGWDQLLAALHRPTLHPITHTGQRGLQCLWEGLLFL